MKHATFIGWMLLSSLLVANRCALGSDELDAFFETKIRPVLVDVCLQCHGENKASGGLRIDSREALMKGGETGPSVVLGTPEESLLIRAIARHDDVSAMPPEKEKALRFQP